MTHYHPLSRFKRTSLDLSQISPFQTVHEGWQTILVQPFDEPKDLDRHVELRKTFGEASFLILVGLDGWYYKRFTSSHESSLTSSDYEYRMSVNCVAGKNVRISMNAPAMLTFDQFSEINQMVRRAHDHLAMLLHNEHAQQQYGEPDA